MARHELAAGRFAVDDEHGRRAAERRGVAGHREGVGHPQREDGAAILGVARLKGCGHRRRRAAGDPEAKPAMTCRAARAAHEPVLRVRPKPRTVVGDGEDERSPIATDRDADLAAGLPARGRSGIGDEIVQHAQQPHLVEPRRRRRVLRHLEAASESHGLAAHRQRRPYLPGDLAHRHRHGPRRHWRRGDRLGRPSRLAEELGQRRHLLGRHLDGGQVGVLIVPDSARAHQHRGRADRGDGVAKIVQQAGRPVGWQVRSQAGSQVRSQFGGLVACRLRHGVRRNRSRDAGAVPARRDSGAVAARIGESHVLVLRACVAARQSGSTTSSDPPPGSWSGRSPPGSRSGRSFLFNARSAPSPAAPTSGRASACGPFSTSCSRSSR